MDSTSCASNGQIHNVLDFDWTLKWIFGTSTVAKHQEPLVNLIFHVKSQDQLISGEVNPNSLHEEVHTISTELNQSNLQLLISALEQVKIKS